MDDFEKNRVEYVANLERQIEHLQRRLAEMQPLAEKWTPKIEGRQEIDGTVRFTASFGGKNAFTRIGASELATNAPGDVTTHVLEALDQTLFQRMIRPVLEAEVERMTAIVRSQTAQGEPW